MAARNCKCGKKFFVDFRWKRNVCTPKIHIELQSGRTQEVKHCPGCGGRLEYEEMIESS